MHAKPKRPSLRLVATVGVRYIVTGVGGKQILVEDPAGNAVELFEPTRA